MLDPKQNNQYIGEIQGLNAPVSTDEPSPSPLLFQIRKVNFQVHSVAPFLLLLHLFTPSLSEWQTIKLHKMFWCGYDAEMGFLFFHSFGKGS